MLIQFTFNNYKSFRDDTVLDMSATKSKEMEDHITVFGREKILPVAVIYGANASGKSNVIRAFDFMKKFVLASYNYGAYDDKAKKVSLPELNTFLFDETTVNGSQTFEVYFTTAKSWNNAVNTGKVNLKKDFVYNYGFVVNRYGIAEEWLNKQLISNGSTKMKSVFYRDEKTTVYNSGVSVNYRNMIGATLSNEKLIVSVGARFEVDVLKTVYKWFRECDIIDFGDSFQNFRMDHSLPYGLDNNSDINTKNNVIEFFSSFDSSIRDIRTEKITSEQIDNPDYTNISNFYMSDTRNLYEIYSMHKKVGSNDLIALKFSEESAGTHKMFAIYKYIKNILANGGLLFADELNAQLHPLLMRLILQTFLNPQTNPNHAQIVLTTHDVWLLDCDILRKDEIWFAEKDDEGISNLYSLAEFKDNPQKDNNSNLLKDYLLGKYGAIPYLHNLNLTENKQNE